MSEQILAIDQGTFSTRAIVFDAQGRLISQARQAVALQRHTRVEIEQSTDDVLQSMQTVLTSVLEDPAVNRDQLSCAGLATQRSSVLGWQRGTGKPLSPILSWQDRRATSALDQLAEHHHDIQQLTGLHLSPHYGASKLQWLLENNADVNAARQDRTLVMGPLASFLLHHLTDCQDDNIDDANASRTLLWNLLTRNWDNNLCKLFNIPLDLLPDCKPIHANYGSVKQAGIPLTAASGDQTAALYAQGRPDKNCLYVNIGTGAFVILPVDDPGTRPDGLLAGVSSSRGTSAEYYLEGTVNSAAAALKWVAARYRLGDIRNLLPNWLAGIKSPPLFINTLGGLGSPWWKGGPDAYFSKQDITGKEAVVATIESIVFLIQSNLVRMRPVNPAINRICISGGLANVDAVCQKLADLSGLVVERPILVEATARGIAWLAAGRTHSWVSDDSGEQFLPGTNKALDQRYQQFIEILKSC